MRRCAVFGVGNSLMADDGIGAAVLAELVQRGLPEGTVILDAGSDPLRIAQELVYLDKAIVIDAADMKLPAGSVRVFNIHDADFPYPATNLSTHGIGLGSVIEILRRLGIADRLSIVGIQPFTINASPGLSEKLDKQVGEIADIVSGLLVKVG